MGMRFKVDVERSATRFFSRCFERENLGVLLAGVGVDSGANDVAVGGGDYGPHIRIRRCQPEGLAGEFKGALKKLFVCGMIDHYPYRRGGKL